MQTGELIHVREYLRTSYRPDCDYVGGAMVKRNAGERDHSPSRFRVADVYVFLEEPWEQIPSIPPFVCFEVPGSEDRLADMQKRVGDLRRGVPYVFILDPKTRVAWPVAAVPLAALFED